MRQCRWIGLALGLIAGCAVTPRAPDLGGLYTRAARYHDADRNPVIVIPGILGTRLQQEGSGRVVWGAFGGGAADAGRPDGARLIALPMATGAPLAQLRDDVVPTSVLDRARLTLLGLPIELTAYAQILQTLGVGGYRDELLAQAGVVDYGGDHYTCFQFGYDWRRDNVENARRLHAFILEKRGYVQRELARRFGTENADVKFDIVAHSMGGLLTRYFLMYGDADLPDEEAPLPTWAGAQHVQRVILVGTPSAGSANALLNLVDGTAFGPFEYSPPILGTMPAIYQLLPRPRHQPLRDPAPVADFLEVACWERYGWGLADPRRDRDLAVLLPDFTSAVERRRVALDHLEKCLSRARRFFAAIDAPADPPPGLELHLFAADSEPTPAVLSVDPRSRRLRVAGEWPGDGTVLRSSALLDERLGNAWQPRLQSPIAWSSVTFLFTDHLGLTRDPIFADNVLFRLLEAPRPRPAAGRAGI